MMVFLPNFLQNRQPLLAGTGLPVNEVVSFLVQTFNYQIWCGSLFHYGKYTTNAGGLDPGGKDGAVKSYRVLLSLMVTSVGRASPASTSIALMMPDGTGQAV